MYVVTLSAVNVPGLSGVFPASRLPSHPAQHFGLLILGLIFWKGVPLSRWGLSTRRQFH